MAHTLEEAQQWRDFAKQVSPILLVGFRNEWLAFYAATGEGKFFPSTVEQCFTDQQIIWAMLDSAERREVVILK